MLTVVFLDKPQLAALEAVECDVGFFLEGNAVLAPRLQQLDRVATISLLLD
jgi:hypothetical protein